MLRYQHLLKEQHDELAILLSSETGKTLADAKGDVWRGIEVVEQAANICSSMMGETVETSRPILMVTLTFNRSVFVLASHRLTSLR